MTLLPERPGFVSDRTRESNVKEMYKICLASTIKGNIQTYMWVGLVLHALNQHPFDDFHVVLLLVAKDSWEVPRKKGRQKVSCLLAKYTQYTPSHPRKTGKPRFFQDCHAGSQQGLTRICAEQLHAGRRWESLLTQREI